MTSKIPQPSTDFKLIEEYHTRSWGKTLLYSIFGFYPVVLGILTLILSRDFEFTLKKEDVPQIITYSIPFFFLFIGIEVVCTTKKNYYRLNDSLSSLFMGTFQQLVGIFTKSLSIIPYCYIYYTYGVHFSSEVQDSWILWFFMFLCVDLGYYWFHRFAHEWNPMWAAHVVHHSSEEYNLTTALRQGAIQPWTSWVFYLPFAFIFPPGLYMWHSQFNTLYQFWIHTRTIHKLPFPFEFIFNTPSHHRVHHGRNPVYLDKNYGGTLIIYDRIFGTFQEELEEVEYGITSPLGTWNPFYLQSHHWSEMLKTASKLPSGEWLAKIRVFLDRGPEYNYHVLKDDKTPGKRSKYDKSPQNSAVTYYCFILSVLSFTGTFLFLIIEDHMSVSWKLIAVGGLLWTLYSVSLFFDQKRYAVPVEIGRILVFSMIGLFFLMSRSTERFETGGTGELNLSGDVIEEIDLDDNRHTFDLVAKSVLTLNGASLLLIVLFFSQFSANSNNIPTKPDTKTE